LLDSGDFGTSRESERSDCSEKPEAGVGAGFGAGSDVNFRSGE
jgi:hypothetical protein